MTSATSLSDSSSHIAITIDSPSGKKKSTPLELNHALLQGDQPCFVKQGYHALKTTYQIQGMGAVTVKGGIVTFATGYTILSSVWEQMGVGHSIKKMLDENRNVGKEDGDIGGWWPLTLFDCMSLKFFLDSNIAEAKFFEVQKLCQDFLSENIIEPDDAYDIIFKRLTDLNAQGLFQKSYTSRILIALEIVGMPTDNQKIQYSESAWALDAQLEPSYRSIESEYKNKCCLLRYFHRIYQGQKSIYETKGIRGQATALTLGALMPVLLGTATVLSVIGEVKLGQQVIGEKDDLPAYGHLGEWLSNMALNLTVAAYSHNQFLLYPGDAVIIENIMNDVLKSDVVNKNSRYYDRLCDIAYQELSDVSSKKRENFFELKLQHKNRALTMERV